MNLLSSGFGHAVDHRADAVVHDKLIGDLLDRSDDLNALAALVGNEQKVRDLLEHAAVDLLDTGFAVDNNITNSRESIVITSFR